MLSANWRYWPSLRNIFENSFQGWLTCRINNIYSRQMAQRVPNTKPPAKGNKMMTLDEIETATRDQLIVWRGGIKVYWDSQDPANEGWAFAIHNDKGLVDTGEADMPEDATASDFEDEILRIADVYGLHADRGSVAVELDVDGGYAVAPVELLK